MLNFYLNKNCLKNILSLCILMILAFSCSTPKIMTASQIDQSTQPKIIRLIDGTEYKIYDGNVRSRVLSDSLVIYDKRNNLTLETVSLSSVNQMIKNDISFRDTKDSISVGESKPNKNKNIKIIIACLAAVCMRFLFFP
jgi:hypothetical protein